MVIDFIGSREYSRERTSFVGHKGHGDKSSRQVECSQVIKFRIAVLEKESISMPLHPEIARFMAHDRYRELQQEMSRSRVHVRSGLFDAARLRSFFSGPSLDALRELFFPAEPQEQCC